MFTIQQIAEAHSKVKTGADFPQYVRDLAALGVTHYDMFVGDGRIVYYGADNFMLAGRPKYPSMAVSDTGSGEKLKQALAIHQQGQTGYLVFCEQAAEAGVAKWTTHVLNREVTYFDKQGNKLLTESVP